MGVPTTHHKLHVPRRPSSRSRICRKFSLVQVTCLLLVIVSVHASSCPTRCDVAYRAPARVFSCASACASDLTCTQRTRVFASCGGVTYQPGSVGDQGLAGTGFGHNSFGKQPRDHCPGLRESQKETRNTAADTRGARGSAAALPEPPPRLLSGDLDPSSCSGPGQAPSGRPEGHGRAGPCWHRCPVGGVRLHAV